MTTTAKSHEFGLALAGGGVKGAFHVGVLQVLQEHNLRPTYISGTSAGALAGAFFASGYDMKEVVELMTNNSFFRIWAFSFSEPGLLDTKKVFKVFRPYFKDKKFESLNAELEIVTTDIIAGHSKVFSSGPILKPLMASCAFPFVLSPISIGDSLYSDGGVLNNFPTELAIRKAKHTLGIHLSPLPPITKKKLLSTIDVADRVYRISNRYHSLEKLDDCTWTLNPPELKIYGTFTVSKLMEIYELGYKYGNEIIDDIKEKVNT